MLKELTISSDAPGERMFMLGNEAIARGAIEAGVQVAAAYPGTPSTEILGALVTVAKDVGMYVEWSINEMVAFEVSFAASTSRLRGLSIMKQVGVNVALNAIVTVPYWGTKGGLVLVACDEAMSFSHQEYQDTRWVGQRSYIPILEPASVQEAKDMMVDAYSLSEQFNLPFILRSVTGISHARSDVVLGELPKEKKQGSYVKEYMSVVQLGKEQEMFARFNRVREAVNTSPYNQLNLTTGAKLGIIACGISYSYAVEAIRDLGLTDKVSVLKIGTPHPLPEELVKRLLNSVEEILVVEEIEPFVEFHVKAIAGEANIPLKIHGRDLLPGQEMSTRRAAEAIAKLTGTEFPDNFVELDKLRGEVIELLPSRPAYPCPGCPHRASQYAIKLAARRVARDLGEGIEPIYPADVGCLSFRRTATSLRSRLQPPLWYGGQF